jgi:hypothetical protein
MDIPLLNAIDVEILMHRDTHFGGSFAVMREYYEKDGIGVMPDFELSRINELNSLEESLGENLNEKVLPPGAQEEVKRAKELYLSLREVYESSLPMPKALSDLILTEKENPQKEIKIVTSFGKEIAEALLNLLNSTDFYNPLFPGYGRAPLLAAKCLAKMKHIDAIPHLFHTLGQENFLVDEDLISALVSFGQPAKEFLLRRLQKRPLSKENEHAAIVLSSFPLDEEIALIALSELSQKEVLSREHLASYLICACEGLKKEKDRQIFIFLANQESTPASLKPEFLFISHTW